MGKKQRILIVDDDKIMLRALTISLERTGYEVTPVSNVADAENVLSSMQLSVVITDLFLPDGDGLKVSSLVNKTQPNTPVLAMTGYGHTELGQKAKQLFGERLFEKPFKKKVLIGKVRAIISNE